MASMAKCDETEFIKLLQSAERFIFLVFKITQRPSHTKNSHFYRLANLVYFDKQTVEDTIADIEWLIDGESGEGNDYKYFGWFDLNKFQIYIQDQYEKGAGYYSWDGLRYFLFEYELYLQEKANGNQKIAWTDFNKRKKEDTIEHIYPQTPKDKCWTSEFNKYSPKNREKLLHSLGNLVLLAQSKNSELQNKCFDFKKKHTNKDGDEIGFYNGAYSEIEVSSYDTWTPKEIASRAKKMLTFLDERWSVDFSGWEEVVDQESLLGLNFINNEKVSAKNK